MMRSVVKVTRFCFPVLTTRTEESKMARTWNVKNTTTYTYENLDGSRYTLHAGKDGVTKKLIKFLRADDNDVLLQDRYQQENTCYDYQHATERADDSDYDNDAVSPLEQIPDTRADIMQILYPEAEHNELILRLREAVEELTDNQRDLIHDLYGLGKSLAEVAREQNVTRGAIQDRERKILARLRKMVKFG